MMPVNTPDTPMDDWDDDVLSQAAYIMRAVKNQSGCAFSFFWPIRRQALELLEARGAIRTREQDGTVYAWGCRRG